MLFRCSPVGKLDYIKELQRKNLKVLMVGDGLNDAGALRQSDVGMVISENNRNFTPASDIIFPSRLMHRIDRILSYSNYLKKALNGAFVIALVYNTIGLFLAVTGQLSPVAAAILMPASSIVIMSYGILVNKIYYLFEGNKVE